MNNKKEYNKVVRNLMIGTAMVVIITFTVGCSAVIISSKPQREVAKGTQTVELDVENNHNLEEQTEEQNLKNELEQMEATKEAIEIDNEAKPPAENLSSSENTKEPTTKPMVIPEKLPEEQVYAAYNNTLIIGDSRTEGFKLYSGVKNASYFCMKAITIDKIADGKTANIDGRNISVYDMLDDRSYDKIIISVGLNELGWNHIETFLKDYGRLIDKIREKQPDVVIYLQAVLPVTRAKSESDKVHNNAQIFWYNEHIVALAENKGVQYVNPAAALVNEEGFLVEAASNDGVHLNSAYCKIWAEYLAQLIK